MLTRILILLAALCFALPAAAEPFPVSATTIYGGVRDLTLSPDTSILADNDIAADTQELIGACRYVGGSATLQTIEVLDEDDQGVALDLIFLDTNTSLGTENAAVSISDANARQIVGRARVDSADYVDLTGSRIATRAAVGLRMKCAAGSTSLYVGVVTRGGTPTYTAAGLKLKMGFDWD